jgi:uncharacterized protein
MSELLLNVGQMREARARIDRTVAVDAFPPDPEMYCLVEPVALAADVHRDRDQFRLVGRVRTTIELTCCRCLEGFRKPVDEAVEVLYLPLAKASSEGEREIEDDDLAVTYYQDDVIDLGQLLQEQFYLAVPMKPLCRENCRGLCPLCGTNLNTASCSCTVEEGDPRLAVLRGLLKKD